MLLSEKSARHARRDSSRRGGGESRNDSTNTPGPERPTHDDRHQHPLRTGRSRPRAQSPAASAPSSCWLSRIGLIEDIDHNLHLLKRHLPYHESDHVLNIAFNILAGGQRIEHLELRRNDEVYLDALGAERIPDPTTAGDFCRRFSEADVLTLMDAINEARLRVWAQQPAEFFDGGDPRRRRHARAQRRRVQAGDGHRLRRHMGLPSAGDLAGQHRRAAVTWSIAAATAPRTNRPTSSWTRPSPSAAGPASARSCCGATPTSPRPSIWTAGTPRATSASSSATRPTIAQGEGRRPAGRRVPPPGTTAAVPDQDRPAPEARAGQAGDRPRARLRERSTLLEEMVAEFDYRPVACKKSYRMIVLRKRLGVDKGQLRLFEEYRYFFYITNDRDDDGRGGRVLGQRSLRPGEPDRPAQERRARADDAGGRPGEQLGVHGDGARWPGA